MPVSQSRLTPRNAKQIVVAAGAALAVAVVWGAGSGAASANTAVTSSVVRVVVHSAEAPRGVTPNPSIQNGNVVVEWTAQEISSGVKMKSYLVAAHEAGATGHADVIHIVTASGGDSDSSTFTAAELSKGRWRWTVRPKFEQWIGGEGDQSVPVTLPGTATNLPDGHCRGSGNGG